MDRLPKRVVIVDGYSTGVFYMPLLRELGIEVIHVRSTPVSLNAHITDIANAALKKRDVFHRPRRRGSAVRRDRRRGERL